MKDDLHAFHSDSILIVSHLNLSNRQEGVRKR